MSNSHKIYTLGAAILLSLMIQPLSADELDQVAMSVNDWQYNRLFSPSPRALEAEKRGSVVIYDGLSDVTIKQALDQQFDRIQNMMFTRTVITDENGEPEIDPDTGNVLVEEDGC